MYFKGGCGQFISCTYKYLCVYTKERDTVFLIFYILSTLSFSLPPSFLPPHLLQFLALPSSFASLCSLLLQFLMKMGCCLLCHVCCWRLFGGCMLDVEKRKAGKGKGNEGSERGERRRLYQQPSCLILVNCQCTLYHSLYSISLFLSLEEVNSDRISISIITLASNMEKLFQTK